METGCRVRAYKMKAIECVEKIINMDLPFDRLRFCFVDDQKKPYKTNGELARPNVMEDFVSLPELLESAKINDYVGIGISIQASKVFAIDVDKCFYYDPINGQKNQVDGRAREILDIFDTSTYCEYSFSGTGLRILFDADLIEDYSNKYYIKNSEKQIEFYQPTSSFRYVTLTGNAICNSFSKVNQDTLSAFLESYMKRPIKPQRKVDVVDTASIEILKKRIKILYLTDHNFQDLWFGKAPGSGKDESERDYHIMVYLYEKVTQDKNILKELFESSPFFKSKDWKHIKKWEQQDFRYFNYVFARIAEG